MIWHDVELVTLEERLNQVRPAIPPPIWELAQPDVLGLREHLASIGKWEPRVHPASGGFDAIVYGNEWREVLDWTTSFARRIDPERSWGGSEQDFYRPEEDRLWGGPNRRNSRLDDSGIVVAEIESQLHEVPSVGPGGRVRALRQTSGLLIEATVRRCERPVGGEWRSIGPIVDSIREASADVEPMTIRFTFGYHEASKFETQQWLRPVFVFLLEQPDLQAGPRWRIALVQAATEGDDLPPDAGLEGVLGHCG